MKKKWIAILSGLACCVVAFTGCRASTRVRYNVQKQADYYAAIYAAIAFLKLSNSELAAFMKQVANSDKATGQLQHAGRQKQG